MTYRTILAALLFLAGMSCKMDDVMESKNSQLARQIEDLQTQLAAKQPNPLVKEQKTCLSGGDHGLQTDISLNPDWDKGRCQEVEVSNEAGEYLVTGWKVTVTPLTVKKELKVKCERFKVFPKAASRFVFPMGGALIELQKDNDSKATSCVQEKPSAPPTKS